MPHLSLLTASSSCAVDAVALTKVSIWEKGGKTIRLQIVIIIIIILLFCEKIDNIFIQIIMTLWKLEKGKFNGKHCKLGTMFSNVNCLHVRSCSGVAVEIEALKAVEVSVEIKALKWFQVSEV